MQERRISIANALELCLSCTNPSRWSWDPSYLCNENPYTGKMASVYRDTSLAAGKTGFQHVLKLEMLWEKFWFNLLLYIDGLVQERRNSSALAVELCLSCTDPSLWQTICISFESNGLNCFFSCNSPCYCLCMKKIMVLFSLVLK